MVNNACMDSKNKHFSSVFTHENLTNIPTLESKDDTCQLDDMAIFLLPWFVV